MDCDWGVGRGGHCCKDICRCLPCCGDPSWNLGSALYCFVCWCCCTSCITAKMYSTSLGQKECGILSNWMVGCIPCILLCPSFIPVIGQLFSIASCIFSCYLYVLYNLSLRRYHGVGSPDCTFGDWFLPCCCNVCMHCHYMRSLPIVGWDWFSQVRQTGCICDNGTGFNYLPRDKMMGASGTVNSPLLGKTVEEPRVYEGSPIMQGYNSNNNNYGMPNQGYQQQPQGTYQQQPPPQAPYQQPPPQVYQQHQQHQQPPPGYYQNNNVSSSPQVQTPNGQIADEGPIVPPKNKTME